MAHWRLSVSSNCWLHRVSCFSLQAYRSWPVRGDPFQRSQRVFIVAVHVLISMALNIIFFDDYEECIYRCDHHFPAGVDDPTTPDPACSACPVEEDWETCAMGETAPINESRTCVDEEMPGLLASLITVAIVVPVIGLINVLVRPRPVLALSVSGLTLVLHFQFGWLRRELVADIMMRSGEMWDRMKKESAHDWATKREKMMLGAMNPKQVEQYARQIVDKTTLKQRVDADTIETIIAEATADQTSRIAKLTAELKEHASKQGTRKNLTQAHQDCMTQLWEVKTIAEQSKKEALTKVSDSQRRFLRTFALSTSAHRSSSRTTTTPRAQVCAPSCSA